MSKHRRTRAANAERHVRPPAIDPNQTYSIGETCAALGISRATYYKHLSGRIRTVEFDDHPRVPGAEIIRLVNGEAAPQAAA